MKMESAYLLQKSWQLYYTATIGTGYAIFLGWVHEFWLDNELDKKWKQSWEVSLYKSSPQQDLPQVFLFSFGSLLVFVFLLQPRFLACPSHLSALKSSSNPVVFYELCWGDCYKKGSPYKLQSKHHDHTELQQNGFQHMPQMQALNLEDVLWPEVVCRVRLDADIPVIFEKLWEAGS